MVDLVWFLPEESLDVIVRDLMGQFAKLMEKEESLGEVLTLRMWDNNEYISVIDKIRDIQKRTDMQGFQMKLKNHV